MTPSTFDELSAQMATGGAEAVLDTLASRLRAEKKYHELFDALLMRTRHELGLPVVMSTPLDELPEPLRTKVEEAYLDACREVGSLLLGAGQIRAAWMYLRPVGERGAIVEALREAAADPDQLQDIVEIALHEGVDPTLGYRLVLEHYGTCNAISTFESTMPGRPRADQQAAAGLLVRHLHRDLLANVQADIARREGTRPTGSTLAELIAGRDWLFDDGNYHVDTTHLAAVVRVARLSEDPEVIRLALDMARYGRLLAAQFQFAGEEPFVDLYPAHELFFAAQLGEEGEQAVQYFRRRAAELDLAEHGTLAVETLIVLLARLGRYADAIDVAIDLLPQGTRTTGFAPTLLELARSAGVYGRAIEALKSRGDVIGFAASLIESKVGVEGVGSRR